MNAHSPTTIAAPAASRLTLADAIARSKECSAAFDAASPGVEALEHAWFDDRENADKRTAKEKGLRRLGELSQASEDAVNAVIAAPILSLADMRVKAQYLTDVRTRFYFDEPAYERLLANMVKEVMPEVAPVEPDPLAELVENYRQGMASYNASVVEGMDDAEDDAFASKTWRPAYDRLRSQAPAATTLPGAVSAVRLALDDMGQCADAGLQRALLRAALAYFDGAQA